MADQRQLVRLPTVPIRKDNGLMCVLVGESELGVREYDEESARVFLEVCIVLRSASDQF